EQVGAPLDLYDNPANLFVAGFIGSPKMNFLKGVIAGTEAGKALVRLPDFGDVTVPVSVKATGLATGTPVTFGIRPEHFDEAGSASIAVVVDILEHLGGETLVYARAVSGNSDLVTISASHREAGKSGETLTARFSPDKALLFDAEGKRIY
ncbi:TOBE domain-containing protein, partial [Oryzibacter oryziterrae]